MTLVDTSVWVNFLRVGDVRMEALLDTAAVATHPLVIGELALGNLTNRGSFLAMLLKLPDVPVAIESEVLDLIERHELMGKGVGIVDAHIAASARLAGLPLWTLDKRLNAVAHDLGIYTN